MYIPKSVALALLCGCAVVLGWMLNGFVNGAASATDAPLHATSTVAYVEPGGAAVSAPPTTQVVNLVVREGSRSTLVVTRAGSSPVTHHHTSTTSNLHARNNYGQDYSITATGTDIVVAAKDSIASVGQDGSLNANTGNAGGSGTIGVDLDGSTASSGNSTRTPTPQTAPPSAPGTSGTQPSSNQDGLDLNMLDPGRSVAIAGYEDHSLGVHGDSHVVTYDDSNVFIARDGQINANTGDTDSSGLNVVDAVDSVVRSGNHHDDGGDGDEPDTDPDTEGEGDTDSDEEPPAGLTSRQAGGPGATTVASPSGAAATNGTHRASASSGTDDGATSAQGEYVLVIGGDGYDNLAVDVSGRKHVVSYDDSNVVLGGSGRVNAQVGDSDTGGTVVMGVKGSTIGGGTSQ